MPILRKLLILCLIISQNSYGQDTKIILPTGHTGYVTSLSFSPDGAILASGAGVHDIKNAVIFWDVKTGREIGLLPVHDADHITFSHDGNFIAAGGCGGVTLWDVTTREIKKLQDAMGWIYSIAFTSDSKYIASGLDPAGQSYLHKIQIRSVDSGKIVRSFSGKIQTVCSMAFSPTDSILATSGGIEDPNIIELWNPWTGELLKTITKKGIGLLFSTDGKNLIACNEENGLNIFKMPECELIYSGGSIGYPIGFTKKGDIVAYKDNGRTATFFNLSEKKISRVLRFDAWFKFAYEPHYNVIASVADRGKIVLRDADNADLLYTFGSSCKSCGSINLVSNIFINSIDSSLAIQTQDSIIRVWSFLPNKFQIMKQLPKNWSTTGKNPSPKQQKYMERERESEIDGKSQEEDSYFSSNSKHIAFVDGYYITIVDVDSGYGIKSFQTSSYYPKCTFSADNRKLLVESDVGVTILDIGNENTLGNLVSLADSDWVFVTPEGLYYGTKEGIKYPSVIDNNQPILLENCNKCKFVPGLLKKVLIEK